MVNGPFGPGVVAMGGRCGARGPEHGPAFGGRPGRLRAGGALTPQNLSVWRRGWSSSVRGRPRRPRGPR
eukprot:11227915-Lingulodinium_polyedra.AAC.1